MPVETRQARRSEEERCTGCGNLLFKIYEDKGCCFVEIKCDDCNRIVLKKFLRYERIGGNNA